MGDLRLVGVGDAERDVQSIWRKNLPAVDSKRQIGRLYSEPHGPFNEGSLAREAHPDYQTPREIPVLPVAVSPEEYFSDDDKKKLKKVERTVFWKSFFQEIGYCGVKTASWVFRSLDGEVQEMERAKDYTDAGECGRMVGLGTFIGGLSTPAIIGTISMINFLASYQN